MAVIVKGMDMPKSCKKCPAFATTACELWSKQKTYSDQMSKKHDSCPLKSVEGLIEKIETDMSHYMYDDYGNTTAEHDVLAGIIKEYCGLEE